jgi:hypothetical protein
VRRAESRWRTESWLLRRAERGAESRRPLEEGEPLALEDGGARQSWLRPKKHVQEGDVLAIDMVRIN